MAKLVKMSSLPPHVQSEIIRRAFQFPMYPHPLEMALLLNRGVYRAHLEKRFPFKYSPLFKKKLKGYFFIDGNRVVVFD